MSKSHDPSDAAVEADKPTSSHTKAQHAFEQSRDGARAAARSLEANPLGVLVGGLAVGALAAALIPRSDKERGQAELESRGLTRDGARDQARQLFEGLTKAATSAGTAAMEAARGKTA